MSLLDWINPINKAADIVAEVVEDKDKRNELNAQLEQLRQQVYITELNTRTIPWVDALHKMGRQILALLNVAVPAVLLWHNPEIDPAALMFMAAPSGIYSYVKGKGR